MDLALSEYELHRFKEVSAFSIFSLLLIQKPQRRGNCVGGGGTELRDFKDASGNGAPLAGAAATAAC